MNHSERKFRIDIIDYSFGRIMGKKSLLKPFTTFKVPGAHFSQQYKKKRWDGTVSIIKYNKLPLGLLPYIIGEGSRRGLVFEFYLNNQRLTPLELEQGIMTGPAYPKEAAIQMVSDLPENIVSRYYQIDSLEAILSSCRGLIVLPTGSGKSLSIYMLAYLLRSMFKTGLILVPRTALVDQLTRDFMLFSSATVNVLSSAEHGRDLLDMLEEKDNIIISTWQSWSRWQKDNIAIDPDYVIVDEAHTLAKKKLPWDYMKSFANTRYRYGLTATENELIFERLALEGLLGPVVYRERPELLIKEGFLAKPHIIRIFMDHNLVRVDNSKIQNRDLVRRPERMSVVADIIDRKIPKGESLLILTESVQDEILPLADFLTTAIPDTDIYTLTRIARREEREQVIALIDKPIRRTVLIVTYGLFQMGINIPSLQHIMLHAPSGSHIRVLQSIGRGLRPKDKCFVYDLIDYCEEKIDTMSGKRLKIYQQAYGDQLVLENEYTTV